ncbi:hypothetical protein ACTG9Q_27185 [Actinokineospora sp. 24-640]
MHFLNDVFCAGTDTNARYKPNVVRGFNDGTFSGSYVITKDGNCEGLLSRHSELRRTS